VDFLLKLLIFVTAPFYAFLQIAIWFITAWGFSDSGNYPEFYWVILIQPFIALVSFLIVGRQALKLHSTRRFILWFLAIVPTFVIFYFELGELFVSTSAILISFVTIVISVFMKDYVPNEN